MGNQLRNVFSKWLVILVLVAMLLSGCDILGGAGAPSSDMTVDQVLEDVKAPEEEPIEVMEPEVVTLEPALTEEPDVKEKHIEYKAIEDKEFYKNKYLGNIFIIKDWQTVNPNVNSMTIFGKIPFTIHPDQDISAFESNIITSPVVLTGFGEGWAKSVFRGEGGGGSSVCTTEIKTEFTLTGDFYPATCEVLVDITTKYLEDDIATICVYNNELELPLPNAEWVDNFTDIKLPIGFRIPDVYVTSFKKTENNVKYDLSYYLYDFWGKPPSPEELSLVIGNTPVQFFNTGCENVHIQFDPAFFPEGSEGAEAPPSAWDIMLIPESQRDIP